jgi:hypothetical protein
LIVVVLIPFQSANSPCLLEGFQVCNWTQDLIDPRM